MEIFLIFIENELYYIHVAEVANDKLLKVAAIYGANASGKSNVYDTFEYMTYNVYESFKFGDEEERRRKTGDSYLKNHVEMLMYGKEASNRK